ncbi:MAG: histidine phosphatase family protein [Candidatus Promineifilaceae bacterium]|nr:histidine phosphatase family protein [Candidatus Promineifilaceae bacterium]
MSSPTVIYLVRHGHIVNVDEVFHGRLPGFRLSEEGRAQAAAAAAFLSERPITAIYHSPMERARQTAEIVQEHFPPPRPSLNETPLLNEIFSPFDGRPWTEMAARDWDFYTGSAPEYEQPADIVNRMLAFLQRVRRLHTGEHVVGVTHADPLAFIWMWVLQQDVHVDNRRRLLEWGLQDEYPATASISIFTFESTAPGELPDSEYVRPY